MFSTCAAEAVPERAVTVSRRLANAASLVKRLLSNKYTIHLCDFTRSRTCSRTRTKCRAGCIGGCHHQLRRTSKVLYMRQGCGETCGEATRLRHWICAQDGILTGRGLHKSPLPPNSAAPPCSRSQLLFAPGAGFRLRTLACFVSLP